MYIYATPFRVWGLGFGVWGLGFWVWPHPSEMDEADTTTARACSVGFRVEGSKVTGQGPGFRGQGSGIGLQG